MVDVVRKPSTDAIPRGGEGVVRHGFASFYGAPVLEDVRDLSADVGFLGVPFDLATNDRPGSRFGPGAVRDASVRFHSPGLAGWVDAERGVRILEGVSMVDVGDVDIRTVGLMENFDTITEAARLVRRSGAFPVFVGGDHAITFAIVRAFDDTPLTIVQFDAHQDYTDEKFGVRYSHDNQMRRCHELPHVRGIAQVGIRGLLERAEPWEAARANGVQVVPAARLIQEGVEQALSGLEIEPPVYLTLDVDVMDPAAIAGTGYPQPGGLSYYLLKDALFYVASRHDVIGFDVTEINPLYDPAGITARTGAILILDLLGAVFTRRADTRERSGKDY